MISIDDILLSNRSYRTKLSMLRECIDFYNVNSNTITLLLSMKKNCIEYLEIFKLLVNSEKTGKIFSSEHLYNIIFQSWADLPLIIPLKIRKKLIRIGIGNNVSNTIVDDIKKNPEMWFSNNTKNIIELINYLCKLDSTCEINSVRFSYVHQTRTNLVNTKLFQKKNNITQNEYQIRVQKTKANGLCSYVRRGLECPLGINCMFYHGKIEETYGIQLCRKADNCQHFKSGECKFIHIPNKTQIANTKNIYGSLEKDGDFFKIPILMENFIDNLILNDPFVILKKYMYKNNYVYYELPSCEHKFGCNFCHRSVKFMTKKLGKPYHFYCCFEHMPKYTPYVVKQNIIEYL